MCKAIDHPCPISVSQREGIILWTIRAWVIGITHRIPVEDQIHDAFRRIGAPNATGQLYAFMWILSQGVSRMLDVDCVCCATISADERALLDVLSLCQQARTFEAMILLRSMVTGPQALAVADSACEIARTLYSAGFILPGRTLATGRYIFANQVQPGLAPTYH